MWILALNSVNYATKLHGETRSSDFKSLSFHAMRKHFTDLCSKLRKRKKVNCLKEKSKSSFSSCMAKMHV